MSVENKTPTGWTGPEWAVAYHSSGVWRFCGDAQPIDEVNAEVWGYRLRKIGPRVETPK